MGKLAIFDTEHFEVLGTLLRLFEPWGHEITVYTDEATCRQLQFGPTHPGTHQWVLRGQHESRRAFISRCAALWRQSPPGLLFISSAPDNHAFLAWQLRGLKNTSVVLTLHDINSYFRFPASWSFKALVRAAGKRMLYRRTDALHVLSRVQQEYLLSDLQVSKKVFVIPGALNDGTNLPLFSRPLKIVVPGSVDERRRDYSQVFRLLEIPELSGLDISITLLGGFSARHGQSIRSKCEGWSRSHTNLHFYDQQVIDQPVFDQVLTDSHFLWMPLRPKLVLEYGITEEYGRSISSGNTGDMIRSGRPVILPAGLPLPEAPEAGSIRYGTVEELASYLTALDAERYDHLAQVTATALAAYSVGNIAGSNRNLFSLLKTT